MIGQENKTKFVNKYLPLALEELVYGLKIGEEEEKKEGEEKEAIKEEEEEEDSSDEEDEEN